MAGRYYYVRTGTQAMLALALLMFMPVDSAASNDRFLTLSSAFPPPQGARDLCITYDWACAGARMPRIDQAQEWEQVQTINRRINRSVRDLSDQQQYKRAEKWALPTRRGGDCEDFALLKKRELVLLGVDPSRLLLATALDRRRRPHAVLVYRSSRGDLVLDNLTDHIRNWRDTRYLFLRMQNPEHPDRWVGLKNPA